MKIAQISDLHLSATGKTLNVAPMAENLGETVARINRLAPDLVIVSGDITHAGQPAEAARAAKILAALQAPFYITPGNHDDRGVLRQVFGKTAMPGSEPGHASYCIDTPQLRLVALDSTDPDAPNGRICQTRADWLAAQLATASGPVILFMHHPPVRFGVEETDRPPLQGADLLADVVARHPAIERILCGHIHLQAQTLWQGCLVCVAPSLGMQLSWDPATPGPSRFFVSPPAFLLHMANDDGALVSHSFTVAPLPAPLDFS